MSRKTGAEAARIYAAATFTDQALRRDGRHSMAGMGPPPPLTIQTIGLAPRFIEPALGDPLTVFWPFVQQKSEASRRRDLLDLVER